MKRATSVALILVLSSAGCTSTGYAPLGNPGSLVATDGIIVLDDDHGTTLPVTPDSMLTFETDQGWTEPIRAGRLCRTADAFAVRTGSTCDGAYPIVPYDAIRGVEVETMDRAGTVAIVSAVSAVVLAALAAITLLGKGSGGSGSSSSSSGHAATGSTAHFHLGGGHVHHGGDLAGAAFDIAANAIANSATSPASETPDPPPAMAVDGPFFTPREVRRADLGVLVDLDGTASAFTHNGVSTGVHAGIRAFDFVDVGIGGRLLEGGSSVGSPRFVPSAIVGLHGEFPRARWIALGLSFEGGHGDAVNLYLDARFGVRFEPFRGFWLGVYPIHPSYVDWAHGRGEHWVPQSSLDIAYGF